MMKKVGGLLCLIIMLLSMTMTALAGSVPEDLLHSDDAQIFFAEVVYYHPDRVIKTTELLCFAAPWFTVFECFLHLNPDLYLC